MESASLPADIAPDQIVSPASRKKYCDRCRRDSEIRSLFRLAPAAMTERTQDSFAQSVCLEATTVLEEIPLDKPRPPAAQSKERRRTLQSHSALLARVLNATCAIARGLPLPLAPESKSVAKQELR